MTKEKYIIRKQKEDWGWLACGLAGLAMMILPPLALDYFGISKRVPATQQTEIKRVEREYAPKIDFYVEGGKVYRDASTMPSRQEMKNDKRK